MRVDPAHPAVCDNYNNNSKKRHAKALWSLHDGVFRSPPPPRPPCLPLMFGYHISFSLSRSNLFCIFIEDTTCLICNVWFKVISFPSCFTTTPWHWPPNLLLGFSPLFSLLVGVDGGRSSARRCVCSMPPFLCSESRLQMCVFVCVGAAQVCVDVRSVWLQVGGLQPLLWFHFYLNCDKRDQTYLHVVLFTQFKPKRFPSCVLKMFAANFKEHKASRVYTEIHKQRINIEIEKIKKRPAHHQPSLHVHQSNLSDIDLKPLPLSFPLRL